MAERTLPNSMPVDVPDDPTQRVEHRILMESLEDAHICARLAWYRADEEDAQANAIAACKVVGVNYLHMVEQYLLGTGCSFDIAKRQVAEWLRDAADNEWLVSSE